MLVQLTNQWRERAAAILVVLYTLCLVTPAAAFAFGNSAAAAHCLTIATDDHHGTGESHAHDQGDTDHHKSGADGSSTNGDDHGLPGKCCGLFCVTAIAPPAFGVAEMQRVQASAVAMPVTESLLGRSSSRIDRPPRVLPSL